MSNTDNADNTTNTNNLVTNHFINVKLQQISAKKHIRDDFDYEINDIFYEKFDENGVPIVYNFLYRYILNLPETNRPVTLSPDPLVSASTIVGLAEKYIYTDVIKNGNQDCVTYKSKLKIVYFTAQPHLSDEVKDISLQELSNMTLSNAICSTESTITKHKLALNADQFVLIGINMDILSELQKEELASNNVTYYSLQQTRKKKIKNIMKAVNNFIGDDPVHIVFDMACVDINTAPCVTRFIDHAKYKTIDGFTMHEIEDMLTSLNKKHVVGLDITGYDLRIERSERAFRVTCEVPRRILRIVLNITEKKINIFTEHSKFLIWRPIEQIEPEDVGWFILRNVSLEVRERLIEHIGEDRIITFETVDEETGEPIDAYITVTTIYEQQQKMYSPTNSIHDAILYPAQKISAMFELLNTNENSILADETQQNNIFGDDKSNV
jgi:arginase family enzyme